MVVLTPHDRAVRVGAGPLRRARPR
jgi:hypothetical protein